MAVIIIASRLDYHAAVVAWALEEVGHQVVFWESSGCSPNRQGTIEVDENTNICIGELTLSSSDTVWLRRPQPVDISEHLFYADKKFVTNETNAFFMSFLYQLEVSGIRCVNPCSVAKFIEHKTVQLVLARRAGFSVPHTIFGNNGRAISKFLDKHSNNIVHKSFLPHLWGNNDSGGAASTQTFDLGTSGAYYESLYALCPGIYQERICKVLDVRLVMMGANLCAFALRTSHGDLDWRTCSNKNNTRVEAIEIPSGVRVAVHRFTNETHLVFGSFDFAVDQRGQWWFLEVNEGGQFLWLDDWEPTCGLLQQFVQFLIYGSHVAIGTNRAMTLREWPSLADFPYPETAFDCLLPSQERFISIEDN